LETFQPLDPIWIFPFLEKKKILSNKNIWVNPSFPKDLVPEMTAFFD